MRCFNHILVVAALLVTLGSCYVPNVRVEYDPFACLNTIYPAGTCETYYYWMPSQRNYVIRVPVYPRPQVRFHWRAR